MFLKCISNFIAVDSSLKESRLLKLQTSMSTCCYHNVVCNQLITWTMFYSILNGERVRNIGEYTVAYLLNTTYAEYAPLCPVSDSAWFDKFPAF